PRLQANPRQDMRDLRESKDERLTTYGWVDRNAGVVRIPIDEAMKLTLQRGLPSRPATEEQVVKGIFREAIEHCEEMNAKYSPRRAHRTQRTNLVRSLRCSVSSVSFVVKALVVAAFLSMAAPAWAQMTGAPLGYKQEPGAVASLVPAPLREIG